MIRYIIISYNNPDLKTMKADISFLCNLPASNDNSYYDWSNHLADLKCALFFDTREYADTYINNMHLENCISYGVDV